MLVCNYESTIKKTKSVFSVYVSNEIDFLVVEILEWKEMQIFIYLNKVNKIF